MKNLIKKFFKKKNDSNFEKKLLEKIKLFQENLKNKSTISFLHYGHLGDIIDSLAVVKEISKEKNCIFYIQKNKKLPSDVNEDDHPFGSSYLSENSILKMLPLLRNQNFLQKVEVYNNEKIDVDLNFFRELPMNFNIDSVRWYSHLTGKHADLSKSWIEVPEYQKYKNYIVIMRSLRRQSKIVDYSFLSSYENIVFIGLKNEYENLKIKIPNMQFYDSKDFLELASIIKSARIFIGNLSFGYSLAEAIKVPRLLESAPNFPLVYPNGPKAYDFYFQYHFEELFKKLYSI